ncbi:unnamed protein product [Protopolystoma xenopodis]|uniref:Uncharacterized protein n=1 Tax=Protopolystoma xenopodis TaxID=117903 RepID=A0A448WU16_9PLAT|nr:unnamed protein product [Protopolystoma xenopodis]
MSGLVSAILGTPADLIKTRLMNSRAPSSGRSHGTQITPIPPNTDVKASTFLASGSTHMQTSSAPSSAGYSGLPSLPQEQHYSGMLDCARKVVRYEGPLALYRGFFLIWARMFVKSVFIIALDFSDYLEVIKTLDVHIFEVEHIFYFILYSRFNFLNIFYLIYDPFSSSC